MVAGHLREQNGYYQMVLNWKGKDGKRKSKSISTRLTVEGNKAKVEQMLLDTCQHFNLGSELENADMLFADFIDKWIHDRASAIPPALYAGYAYSLSANIQPYFLTNRIKLTELTPNEFERFYPQFCMFQTKMKTHALPTTLAFLSLLCKTGQVKSSHLCVK